MNLNAVADGFWALTPSAHEVVLGIIDRHQRGEVTDLGALEAKLGRPLQNPKQLMDIQDDCAIISLTGILCKSANLLTDVSGASSMRIAGQQFAQALADPAVKGIVLAVDSPGGTVDGTQALADQIYAARGKKPICASIDGTGCSAAYWIASAADKVVIANDTSMVGSIGVVASHVDSSASDGQRGLKRSLVASGPLKGKPSTTEPLDSAGRKILQGQVDKLHKVFSDAIARNRGLSGDALSSIADGRILIGREAIQANLADAIDDLDGIIESLQGRTTSTTSLAVMAKAMTVPTDIGDQILAARRIQRTEATRGNILSDAQAISLLHSGGYTA